MEAGGQKIIPSKSPELRLTEGQLPFDSAIIWV
jgi:hypothetical protein